ncbi:MAG: hypothetical protein LBO69_02660 [Ignavibacteria bacterium]|jgi:hypothetical protein|nr:hypothetical protein [Ignavibacteria bacterium]
MKKVLLIVAILFATTLTASAQFSGGSGTQAAPYQITSKADMEALSDSVFYGTNWSIDKYFLLMNDITDSCDYRSIGNPTPTFDTIHYFYGYFDGNNHTIYLKVSASNKVLFGSNHGTIANLIVTGRSVGAGICYENSSVASAYSYTGTIINCSNNATVTGNAAAGICCFVVKGLVKKCTNTGTITGTNAAGISYAISSYGSIEDCVNAGFINGTSAGGIVYYLNGMGTTVTRCINTAAVEGIGEVGAIVGRISTYVSLTDCFYDIQMCKYKAVNNQDHPGVTGLPTHLLMEELAK